MVSICARCEGELLQIVGDLLKLRMAFAVDLEQERSLSTWSWRAAFHRDEMFYQHAARLRRRHCFEHAALCMLAQAIDVDGGGEQGDDQRHRHDDEADQDELQNRSGTEEFHAPLSRRCHCCEAPRETGAAASLRMKNSTDE